MCSTSTMCSPILQFHPLLLNPFIPTQHRPLIMLCGPLLLNQIILPHHCLPILLCHPLLLNLFILP